MPTLEKRPSGLRGEILAKTPPPKQHKKRADRKEREKSIKPMAAMEV
jgi:hypothetical protein